MNTYVTKDLVGSNYYFRIHFNNKHGLGLFVTCADFYSQFDAEDSAKTMAAVSGGKYLGFKESVEA